MKKLLPKIAGAALLTISGLASATNLATCSISDIFFDTPVTVSNCYGFVAGNLVNSSPTDMATVSGILATQFSFTGQTGAPMESIQGSVDPATNITTYDFTQPLVGTVIVGLHFGNGTGGPGNGTAFYEFNAGTGVDKFYTAYNASSNAGLYENQTPVPEPETYAMMLAGLGLVGFIARRRKTRA